MNKMYIYKKKIKVDRAIGSADGSRTSTCAQLHMALHYLYIYTAVNRITTVFFLNCRYGHTLSLGQ